MATNPKRLTLLPLSAAALAALGAIASPVLAQADNGCRSVCITELDENGSNLRVAWTGEPQFVSYQVYWERVGTVEIRSERGWRSSTCVRHPGCATRRNLPGAGYGLHSSHSDLRHKRMRQQCGRKNYHDLAEPPARAVPVGAGSDRQSPGDLQRRNV